MDAQPSTVCSKSSTLHEKKSLHPTQKETERVQKLRAEYWQRIQIILDKDLIFIDEAGVNLAMTRLFARATKGKRAYGSRPSKRGKNVSLIGAISLKGVIAHLPVLGSVDTLTFEAFIHQILIPNLWQGACVVMDNCSIHLSRDIETWLHKAGARLIYLPPYSPDFSPIENFWSKVKQTLRSIGARTYPDLEQAIEQAFSEVSIDDLKGWFTHCCYCTSLA